MTRANRNNTISLSGTPYLITGVILSLLVWIVSYNFVEREAENRFKDAADQASQTAVFFERHVVGIFQYGDAYLKLVRWEFLEHYDLVEIKQLMAEIPLNKSIASHITIIDETGTPVLVSGHEIKPGTTAKDRDYFKMQKVIDGNRELLLDRFNKIRAELEGLNVHWTVQPKEQKATFLLELGFPDKKTSGELIWTVYYKSLIQLRTVLNANDKEELFPLFNDFMFKPLKPIQAQPPRTIKEKPKTEVYGWG